MSGMAALLSRGVSVVSMLITVPLALRYLGADSYGLWMTITSFAAVLGFADLGLGNGLVNAVAEASGRDDEDAIRRAVSSAFFLLVGVAAVGALAMGLAYSLVPWASLYNVAGTSAAGAAAPASLVFALVLLLGLPLGLVARIQSGFQEGYRTGLWSALGGLLGLGGVIAAIEMHAGLAAIVAASVGGPALASAANSFTLFVVRHRVLAPRLRLVSRAWIGRLWRMGAYFFAIQFAIAAAYQSDSIVLAHVLGPSAVAEYSVAMRLFVIAPLVLGLMLAPLWPAYTEALARGDMDWIRSTLRRSIRLGFAVNLVPAVLLVAFGRQVIRAWAGSDVIPSQLLIVALGCWAVLNSLGGPLAMFLNGVGALRWQAVSAAAMAVANLALSIWLARTVGVAGVVLGTVVSQLLFIFVPYLFYVPRLLRRLEHADAVPVPAS